MQNEIDPIICEWCKTPLESVKTLQPLEGQYPGYCPHCKTTVWSEPVTPSNNSVRPTTQAVDPTETGA